MTYLISKGAEIEAKDIYGNTALHDAASNNASNSLKVLLLHKANIEARNNEKWTALNIAAESGACNP